MAKHPVFSSEALQDAEGRVKSDGSGKPFNFTSSGRQIVRVTNVISGSVPEVIPERSLYSRYTESCKLCQRAHDLDKCKTYIGLPVEGRKQFLIQNRLSFACYGLMSSIHNARLCKQRRVCDICGNSHPTGLHGNEHRRRQHQSNPSDDLSPMMPVDHGEGVTNVTTFRMGTRADSLTMIIVKVFLSNDMNPQQKIMVYAALDSMSTASFVSKDIWMRLDHLVIQRSS